MTQRLLVVAVTDRGGAQLLAGHPRYKVVFAAPSVTEQQPVDTAPPPDQAGVVKLLLHYAEVGQALGLSETAVRNLVRRGEINAVSIGRSRRIPVAELERYVEHLGEAVGPGPGGALGRPSGCGGETVGVGGDPLALPHPETVEWPNAHARPPGSITNRSLSA